MISIYLLAPMVSWLVAQCAKYLLNALQTNSFTDFRLLYRSGDMPSAHAAIVMSLASIIGFKVGFDSAVFAIAGVLAAIVIYDAINVRRAVGEHGIALATLYKKKFYSAKGHKPLEVLFGSLIGVTTSWLMMQFL